ncbi:putative pentachlorophenol 4-monooxygenase [alpha proteobacterium BAL199]|jgi:2-polyprenyl-6-methoxyphenol hydroxylase-like FAD-dependent oxidoreductase|nr:putative pentachlorophenol 4-monooxygenase [alpha proteobacterium BAL199]
MTVTDVLIVGAGPVGMAGAIELNRRGASVRIVDREGAHTKLSKAVGINTQTLELLESSGLTERLLAAGIRIARANLHFDGKPLVTLDLSRAEHRFNFILALPQSETEGILESALAERGIVVERETEMIAFSQDADFVTASLRGPGGEHEAAAGRVLGADGPRSAIRQGLGIPFTGARYDETWSLADVTLDWPYGYGEVNLFLHSNGALLFTVPIAPDRIRAISQTDNALALLPAGSVVRETHWDSTFHVALRQAERYQDGCCFLAGDAAHVHSPAGGRGMNLGIWDACAFAARHAAGTLDGYTAERHRIAARILAITDRMFRVARLKPGIAQSARNLVMRNIVPMPTVQRWIAPQLLGIER